MNETLTQRTYIGTLWSAIERFSVQGISFLIVILMARVLTPKDYGLVGMVTIFISIAQSLVDSGFSQALIRKQNRTQIDNSTVFFFNIVVGILLYWVLYGLAPLIASFYNEPILEPITKIISFSVVINSLSVVQRALLTIKMDFKTQCKASLIAVIISGIIGILMAYQGFGVWSIIWYQLCNFSLSTFLLWIFSKWSPSLKYSWNSFHELFKVGFNLAISGIIDTLYNNIYLLVIGKIFRPTELGYYTRAQQFAFFPTSSIANIIQRVSYPTLCLVNNTRDGEDLKRIFESMLRLSCFVVFPIAICLAGISEPLILVVLNVQWLPAASLLVPLCFALMWYPVHVLNLNVILALGMSDKILRIEIFKKVSGVLILLITTPFGVEVMCYGSIVSAFISVYINSYYTGRYLQLGFAAQLKLLFPTLLLSIIMGVVVKTATLIVGNFYFKLVLGIVFGMVTFIGLAYILRSKELNELIMLIYSNIKQKNSK